MTKPLTDARLQFVSNITEESFFEDTSVANQVQSEMMINIFPNGDGLVEWEIPALSIVADIELTFQNNTIVSFYGVPKLPDEIFPLLDQQYDTTRVKNIVHTKMLL